MYIKVWIRDGTNRIGMQHLFSYKWKATIYLCYNIHVDVYKLYTNVDANTFSHHAEDIKVIHVYLWTAIRGELKWARGRTGPPLASLKIIIGGSLPSSHMTSRRALGFWPGFHWEIHVHNWGKKTYSFCDTESKYLSPPTFLSQL